MTYTMSRHWGSRLVDLQQVSSGIEHPVLPDYALEDQDGMGVGSDASRILVVDDDPNILELVAKMTTHLGYRTVNCQGPVDALSSLRKAYFKLVITDYDMPFMDGLELADEIKSKYSGTRVVMMTGHCPATIRDLVSGTNVIDGLLFKPFTLQSLKKSIEVACGNHLISWLP